MSIIYNIGVLGGLIAMVLWVYHKYIYRNIPGPIGIPGFYNLLYIAYHRSTGNWHKYLMDTYYKYGDTFLLKLPIDTPLIFINNPNDVRHILKDNFTNFEKGSIMKEAFQPVLGDGIFNADGNLWRPQRKIYSHMFKIKNLRDMLDVFNQNSGPLLEILHNSTGNDIDIQSLFGRYTLDSISEIAFGINLDTLRVDNKFSHAFNAAVSSIESRLVNPLWKVFGSLIPTEKSLLSSVDQLNAYAREVLVAKQENLKTNTNMANDDIIDKLMREGQTKEGIQFDQQFLRDVIMNFIIAGKDTTTQALSWSIYLLSQNPEKCEKLRNEIAETFPDGEIPDYERLQNMPYIIAVIDETLRLV
eukprot:TRINITY_DN7456_c0_g1_i1.p1 TRINITY_DN7456_c0_g1~~TRINITY_DN7456_c0_g1_i1.p1  ORF type:complete len:358 (-),score=41.01 TRINITY_DN7456_c0_g1_i1:40-1113(-)